MTKTTKTDYKQTEIGEIPGEWEARTLEKVSDFQNGYSFSSKDFVESGAGAVPVFKMGNIDLGGGLKITGKESHISSEATQRLDNFGTASDDILMCMTDMKSSMNLLGYSAQIKDEKFLVNQRVGRIRPKENINPHYLYYFLNSPQYINRLRSTARSGVQVNLTTKAIKKSLIAFPDRNKQNQIASILSSLDDKIELNHKMNKTLEEIGKAIFKEWFIDFNFPDKNGKPYKLNDGKMVDSELGEIPKGWEVSNIDSVCQAVGGGTPSTKKGEYWLDGDIKWATPSDITSLKSPVIFDTERKINEKGLNNSSARMLPEGTILLTSRATVGLLAISAVPITTNQGFISIVCSEDKSIVKPVIPDSESIEYSCLKIKSSASIPITK